MVNAWSLAASILGGTFEEDYPIVKNKNKKTSDKDWQEFWEEDGHSLTGNPAPASPDTFVFESPDGGKTVTRRKPFESKKEVIQGDYYKDIPWSGVEDNRDADLDWIEKSGGFEWTPGSPWPPSIPEDISDRDPEHSDAYYDYKRNDPNAENPFTDPKDRERADFVVGAGNTAAINDDRYMADIDDMYSHYFDDNEFRQPVADNFKFFKYNEHSMLDKAKNYIASTYGSHYTGDKGTQTLDLIEGIGDAEAFCRSNAIKYLSRFGKKDGKNEKDILKAIHYCTLLYHFAGLHNDDSN
tara:strand:+ start:326 stop:1216 length:891 start_codon:yes stop_codon:yes gene_type:complete